MRKILFFLILTLFSGNLVAQYCNLYVSDVRATRWTYQGTIEEAVLSLHPKGGYIENNLYLTFSARGTNFTEKDSLEIQLNFTMPQGAVVTDLWLWVGDSIMRALIMDKWTASNIYEGIVKRRRDPALLIMNGNFSYPDYNLRIFPLPAKGTRRIKLTYLTSAKWQTGFIRNEIPLHFLKASRFEVPQFHVFFQGSDAWGTPLLSQTPHQKFIKDYDSFHNRLFYRIAIDSVNKYNMLEVQHPLPSKNGVYLMAHTKNNEGYYQLSLNASKAIPQLQPPRHILVLMDILPKNASTFPQADIIRQSLEVVMRYELRDVDFFNIWFGGNQIIKVSNEWLPAGVKNVNRTFETIPVENFRDDSNMEQLLLEGIQYIQSTQQNSQIILITNSISNAETESANKLLKKIRELSQDQMRIHVADFNRSYSYYQYIGGISYYANEYFLRNMTRTHHGEYFSILQSGHNGVLYSAFGACNPSFQSFDFSVNPEFGYTYSRYELFKNSGLTLNENIIFQVGKFSGKFPFSLELNGETDGEAFHFNIEIPDSSVCQTDTIPQILWGIEKLHDLLSIYSPNNGQVKEILDTSIKNRILTPYTAFLALEPNDSVRASKNLFDETKLLSDVQSTKVDSVDFDLKLNAYPNPFNSNTVLKISLPAVKSTEKANLIIYNVLGQVIKKYELTNIWQTRRFEVQWDGTDINHQSVATGNYLAILTVGNSKKSIRLCYLK